MEDVTDFNFFFLILFFERIFRKFIHGDCENRLNDIEILTLIFVTENI